MNIMNFAIRAWLRMHGVRWTGASPFIQTRPFPTFSINDGGSIRLGSHCRFGAGVSINAYGGNINIGSRVGINGDVVISSTCGISIGDGTRIAGGVSIMDSSFHQVNEYDEVNEAPIVIGQNVWLGIRVIVLPGVTIGNHSVIGAGTVVSKDVPPYSKLVGAAPRIVGEVICSDNWRR